MFVGVIAVVVFVGLQIDVDGDGIYGGGCNRGEDEKN